MTQALFAVAPETGRSGGSEGESRPDWRALRERLGAAHALRRCLDEGPASAPRGSFAPLAAWAGGVFAACEEQGNLIPWSWYTK